MDSDIKNRKVAVVTGTGTGIGRGVALALIQAGNNVVLTGRNKNKLDATANLAVNARHLAVATDVTKPEEVDALFDETVVAYGRIAASCKCPICNSHGHGNAVNRARVNRNMNIIGRIAEIPFLRGHKCRLNK